MKEEAEHWLVAQLSNEEKILVGLRIENLRKKLSLAEVGFTPTFDFALPNVIGSKQLQEVLGLGDYEDIFLIKPRPLADRFNLVKRYSEFVDHFLHFVKDKALSTSENELFIQFLKQQLTEYKKNIKEIRYGDIFRELSSVLAFSEYVFQQLDKSYSVRDVIPVEQELKLYQFAFIYALTRCLTEGRGASYTEEQGEEGVVELSSYEYYDALAYAQMVEIIGSNVEGSL